MEDIEQGLRKIGPRYSAIDDKRERVLRLLRNGQIKLEKPSPVKMNIQGLRLRGSRPRPVTNRWFRPFFSYERNGILNWGVSMNYARFLFPIPPMFYLVYCLLPAMHGVTYEREYNNFQWEVIYPKMGIDNLPYSDSTITRIA